MTTTTAGLLQGIAAYFIWGLFPLYWVWLKHVPAGEVMAHRILWSCVILALVTLCGRRLDALKTAINQPYTLLLLLISALLISVNWLVYIWAMANAYILESSMGYYINPLVNVLLGALFLRERLRRLQYLALLFAVIGVVVMTVSYGKPPWVALTLALSFGFYALVRKFVRLDSQTALLIETALLLLPAVIYLSIGTHSYAIIHDTWDHRLLLIGGGLVTIVPLLLIANALKHLTLSTLGFLQYLAPTMLFLSAVFLFDEPFTHSQAMSFSFIWVGLGIYTAEAIWVARKNAHVKRANS